MLYAVAVSFQSSQESEWTWKSVDQIYLNSDDSSVLSGWHSKAYVYDLIKNKGKIVKVYISPYPKLIPEIYDGSTKFVRSENDDTSTDNLVQLGRKASNYK